MVNWIKNALNSMIAWINPEYMPEEDDSVAGNSVTAITSAINAKNKLIPMGGLVGASVGIGVGFLITLASFISHLAGDKHKNKSLVGSVVSCATLGTAGGFVGKYCELHSQQRKQNEQDAPPIAI